MGVAEDAEARLEDSQDWEQQAKEGLARIAGMDENVFPAEYGPDPHQPDQRSTVAQPEADTTNGLATEADDLVRELMALDSETVPPNNKVVDTTMTKKEALSTTFPTRIIVAP